MIGFDASTKEGSSSKFIEVTPEKAIAAGRFIKDITAEVNESGKSFLNVEIIDKEEKTANRRYYEPSVDGSIIKNENDLEKATVKLVGVGANIVRRFKGEDVAISGATWKEYFENIVKAVKGTPDWNKKELRVKIILNSSGFPTLPGYAPIMENLNIPISESKLKITQYDTVVAAPVKPDTDTPTTPGKDYEF
jgi:hypothetical protein